MAWTSGFFNSVDGDRKYNADQMSQIFDGLITQGVYESIGNKLAVQPNSGLTVQISTGRGWFGSRWVKNDSEYLIELEPADVILNRYAAICIRADLADSVRTAEPYVKYSDFASSPVKPAMTRTETVKEYCLAYVYIKGGASSISYADIEDTRANTNLCGWVTGLIKQLDTDTLWTQWQALFEEFMAGLNADAVDQQEEFEAFMASLAVIKEGHEKEFDQFIADKDGEFAAWFNTIKGILEDDPATALTAEVVALKEDVTQLQEATNGLHLQLDKITVTLDGLGWESSESGVYTQTVEAPGVTADNEIAVTPLATSKEAYIRMGVMAETQAADSITFTSLAPEDVALSVKVVIMNI